MVKGLLASERWMAVRSVRKKSPSVILCLQKARSSVFLRSPFIHDRAVAQPGSALAWGARGRGFESRQPDHSKKSSSSEDGFFDYRLGV